VTWPTYGGYCERSAACDARHMPQSPGSIQSSPEFDLLEFLQGQAAAAYESGAASWSKSFTVITLGMTLALSALGGLYAASRLDGVQPGTPESVPQHFLSLALALAIPWIAAAAWLLALYNYQLCFTTNLYEAHLGKAIQAEVLLRSGVRTANPGADVYAFIWQRSLRPVPFAAAFSVMAVLTLGVLAVAWWFVMLIEPGSWIGWADLVASLVLVLLTLLAAIAGLLTGLKVKKHLDSTFPYSSLQTPGMPLAPAP